MEARGGYYELETVVVEASTSIFGQMEIFGGEVAGPTAATTPVNTMGT